MRILILSLVFPPDAVSTSQIMGDLARNLKAGNNEIEVITTTPHYNRDEQAEAKQPLGRWWGKLVQRSTFDGITVFHTWMPTKNASVLARLSAWSLFHFLSVLVAIVSAQRPQVILAPSPPLTIGVVAWLIGWLRRAPFVYNVQEMYPDIAINLGAVKNPLLIRILFALERFVYAKSAVVTVIADRMRERLLEKGTPAGKSIVIPNFVDVDGMQAKPAPNSFTDEFGLNGKFVVCYAGNLGPAQGLDSLLDSAKLLLDEPGITLVVVGGGTLWDHLGSRIRSECLTNVKLLPHQPFSRVPEIYGAADLSVVPQAASIGTDAVPSKVYRIMSCKRAVLALTDHASDLARLIRSGQCGVIAPQDQPSEIAGTIRRAFAERDQLITMGENGRAHVSEYYAQHVVTGQYDALLRRVIGETQS